MSYSAYPEYKDSGVEWLGEVPAHWQVLPLKAQFQVVGGSTPSPDEEHWGGQVTWVTPADLSSLPSLEVGASSRQITEKGIASCGATLVPPGSLVLSTRAPIGSLAIASVPLCTNQGCKSLVPANGKEARFFAYLLRNCTEALNVRGKGTTFLELSGDELSSFKVTVPPQNEQATISNFLDHETARIDALVEEQQRLIALLKEKRQAVISHAVTKGLDPDVPMKDSGVEWLGEVPEHWGVGPLRWYATIQGGVAKGKSYDSETPTVELPYLRVANVQDGYVDLSTVKTVEVAISEVGRYRLQAGDVLMNEGGDNDKLGRGTVWEGEVTDCLHQNHVFAIRPNQYLLPHWLSMFTRSNSARAYFYLYSKQSTNLASISSSSVMSCPLPLPSVDEQREVLDFLTIETTRLDDLMHEGRKTIDLLQERRSALISAAVTGKIDVRGWQPPEEANAKETSQQEAV